MKGFVYRRIRAQADLIAIYRHYARKGGIRVADRFIAAAKATFQRLADMPDMGTRYNLDHRAFAGLRFLPLSSRFKVYLVFYRPLANGIEVIRVLHGARDLRGLLDDEFGIDTSSDDDQSEE